MRDRLPALARMTKLSLALLGVMTAGAILDAGCFCGGGGAEPPRMQGCRDPGSDFSGVTDVRLVNAGTVWGPQGGAHFEFQIEADGTNLPSCVAQTSELITADGEVVSRVDAPVVANVASRGGLRTERVLHFRLGGDRVRVQTLGRTLETPVVSRDPFFEDAGRDSGFEDAGDEDAGPTDAGEVDAGEADADGGG